MARLTHIATLLAFIVVILGAYTRLTDAGLGCPDWPGCYGNMIPQGTPESTKAWTEMIHRYFAGALGVIVFSVFGALAYLKRVKKQVVPITLATILALFIVFQALLGMWTVTLRLYPLVVMGHLLGGITTLILLRVLTLQLRAKPSFSKPYKQHWMLGLIALLCLVTQIALGGWTSANYAALVCVGFPECSGVLWPAMNFSQAFDVLHAGRVDGPGMRLDYEALVAIQMTHRIGAVITLLVVGYFAHKTKQKMLALLLLIQIALGITNVLNMLPLSVAVAHNAVAALLVFTLTTWMYQHWRPSSLFRTI